jgi:hypothetical protein
MMTIRGPNKRPSELPRPNVIASLIKLKIPRMNSGVVTSAAAEVIGTYDYHRINYDLVRYTAKSDLQRHQTEPVRLSWQC